MQASIGFPIYWGDNHGGCNVAGTLEFAVLPAPGDRVSLAAPDNGEVLPHTSFDGLLRVEQRIFQPGGAASVRLVLEPVVVDSELKAQMLRQFFARGFRFTAD